MGNCLAGFGHGAKKAMPSTRVDPVVMQREDYSWNKEEEEFFSNGLVQQSGGGGKGDVVRVKIVLTKEEAARLLSESGGSTSEKIALEHVARELMERIERGEMSAAGLGPCHDRWRPALGSIPEIN